MEIGWEYNDENYYRAEDGGGVPKIAYQSKQDAVIACAEMNAKKLELPYANQMITEWHGVDDEGNDIVDIIKDYYEVKEVEYIGE
jgi:hypothetical protein